MVQQKVRVLNELKPCPFCGEDMIWLVALNRASYPIEYWAECELCEASTKLITEKDVKKVVPRLAELWNRRTDVKED